MLRNILGEGQAGWPCTTKIRHELHSTPASLADSTQSHSHSLSSASCSACIQKSGSLQKIWLLQYYRQHIWCTTLATTLSMHVRG